MGLICLAGRASEKGRAALKAAATRPFYPQGPELYGLFPEREIRRKYDANYYER